MTTPTITCPTCKHPHSVFWYVHGSGKKQLAYVCDKQITKKLGPILAGGERDEELRTSTKRILIEPFDPRYTGLNPTREVWSAKWKKKKQEEAQGQLMERRQLMESPGEPVDPSLVLVDNEIRIWLEAKAEAEAMAQRAFRLTKEAEAKLAELGKKRSEILTPELIP